jgi:hypothetical protein
MAVDFFFGMVVVGLLAVVGPKTNTGGGSLGLIKSSSSPKILLDCFLVDESESLKLGVGVEGIKRKDSSSPVPSITIGSVFSISSSSSLTVGSSSVKLTSSFLEVGAVFSKTPERVVDFVGVILELSIVKGVRASFDKLGNLRSNVGKMVGLLVFVTIGTSFSTFWWLIEGNGSSVERLLFLA